MPACWVGVREGAKRKQSCMGESCIDESCTVLGDDLEEEFLGGGGLLGRLQHDGAAGGQRPDQRRDAERDLSTAKRAQHPDANKAKGKEEKNMK